MLTKSEMKDRCIWLHFCLTVKLPLWLFRQLHLSNLISLPCPEAILKHKALVFAADPQNPTGSIGDQALFKGLLQLCKEQDAACQSINILCYEQPKQPITGLNFITIDNSWLGTLKIAACIRHCSGFYLLGADVVDGKYGTKFVCKAMGLLNFACDSGCAAGITGFSFNRQPRWPIIHGLNKLSPKVKLCVRDPASLQRLASFTDHQSTLVADLAFSMPASEKLDPDVKSWLKQCKQRGRLAVGLNINKHAFGLQLKQHGEQHCLNQISGQLANISQQHAIDFILIAHDFKTDAGDLELLTKLQTLLEQETGQSCCYYAKPSPSQIKCIVAQLDFVISARMHLAIACLGMATPVLVINYQDKFSGLLQHFNLPQDYLFEPEQVLSGRFEQEVALMCQQHQQVRSQLQLTLPKVKRLCRENLLTDMANQQTSPSIAPQPPS